MSHSGMRWRRSKANENRLAGLLATLLIISSGGIPVSGDGQLFGNEIEEEGVFLHGAVELVGDVRGEGHTTVVQNAVKVSSTQVGKRVLDMWCMQDEWTQRLVGARSSSTKTMPGGSSVGRKVRSRPVDIFFELVQPIDEDDLVRTLARDFLQHTRKEVSVGQDDCHRRHSQHICRRGRA